MPENTPLVGGQGFPADNKDGTPSLVGKDDYTREEAINRLTRKPVTVLAGNFADLQRLGAEVATGKADTAFAAPPGINPKDENVVTPAQHEAARNEFTRETERTGLIDTPPEPVPAENKSANPVDPTATSPRAEPKGSGTSTSTAAKK